MDENQEYDELADIELVETDDLLEILRNAPRQPQVEIRMTVTDHETGEVTEIVRLESATLWNGGYRPYYKGKIIRDVADQIAEKIAYVDDERRS